MIVGMKKVTVVIKSAWLDEVLKKLGDLGAVHLQPVVFPGNNTIENLRENIQSMEKAVSIIAEGSYKDLVLSVNGEHGLVFAEQLLALNEEAKLIEEEMVILENEYESLKVWGRFDPREMNSLKDAGILIKLFTCNKKDLSIIPEEFTVNIISEDRKLIYLDEINSTSLLTNDFEITADWKIHSGAGSFTPINDHHFTEKYSLLAKSSANNDMILQMVWVVLPLN